ncbi:MAG: DUF58 domain-containing protein [Chloroflexi bacterium]|nr:DUF58 domain-containing protein [Chloroflexota bacterium]
MLGGFWLLITAALFLVSLLLHQVPLLLVALLFFLVGGIARLWGRYCLNRVEYRRRLSANRAFFGDEIHLDIEVSNRKPLPLPWMQVDDEIPCEVTLLKGKTSSSYRPPRMLLTNLFSLTWYHKVTRRYPVKCTQRGYFAFGPARIRSGDLFGFFSRETEVPQTDYLMVYPRLVPLEKLGITSRQPLGDILTRRHIFQDPILTMGVREYHFGDSLKGIHWKTTARRGQLLTKLAETTTTVDMGIFFDVRTVKPPFWGSMPELLELGVVASASIANFALASGYRVGLYVNQNKQFTDEPTRLPPSQHPDQLQFMLESLAQVHSTETIPIARLVLQESRNLPWGSTIVVITAVPTEALLAALVNMKRAGRRVALVTIGGPETPFSQDSLSVYHIKQDVLSSDLDTLTLEEMHHQDF